MRQVPIALLAAVLASGCGSKKKTDPPAPTSSPTASVPLTASGEPASAVAFDWMTSFDACTAGFRGTLIDLGEAAGMHRLGPLRKVELEAVEHEGATWARVRAKTFSVNVVIPEPEGDASTTVTARVRGGAAKSATIYVNTKPIGTWQLAKGETRVVTAHAPLASLASGVNEITVRLNAPAHTAPTEALADIDWIHLGTGEPDATIAAPTRQDVITTTSLGGVSRSALSLRGPGFLRCTVWAPRGARIRGFVGLAGEGEADLEVRLRRDRGGPTTLATMHLGGTPSAWKPLDVAIAEPGHGAIELNVVRASKGARVLVGEPKLLGPPNPEPVAPKAARGVLLVVLGSIATRNLALHGGRFALPELAAIANKGLAFDHHRASSTYGAAATASMLTGLDPRRHALADRDAKLAAKVTTIADAARQAGVQAALFSGNPTTSATFGFDRGWTAYQSFSPDATVGDPFDAAAQFIEAHKGDRFLVVVHARGGHPPWEASAEELKTLDPQGYTGPLDPHHAGELLSRAHRSPGSLRFGDADRARAWALYGLALQKNDAALGRLVGALKSAGRDGDTAVVVTSDAAPDDTSHFPFGESDALDESSLAIPLVMRPPEGSPPELVGKHAAYASASEDVATTVLAALGLAPPVGFDGIDLWKHARDADDASATTHLAQLGEHFSLRLGNLVLAGSGERPSKLCDVALEPACIGDVRASYPIAFELLHRAAYDRLVLREPRATRESASIDAAAAGYLKSWGR